MDKFRRQHEIIKYIALEPGVHTYHSLAEKLGVNLVTLQRDFKEMKENGFEFEQEVNGGFSLRTSGWNEPVPVKNSTLRLLEVLRILTSNPSGLSLADLHKRFNRFDQEEISSKTLERDLKDLEKRKLIERKAEKFKVRADYVLPPLQLEEQEKTLLFEALNVARALAPIPEELRSLEAKLKLKVRESPSAREIIYVHGRTPTQDVHRSQCCYELEEAARSKLKVELLYRKGEEPARQLRLNPLGLVYYWVLDNWYLIAQDECDLNIKTYSVDRIIDVLRLNEPYTPVEGFELKTWYQYAWGVFRNQNPVPVTIRFYNYYSTLQRVQAELAQRKTCTLTEDENGLLMCDRVEGLDELAVWLRGFGAGAEVLEPKELRDKVKGEFEQLLHLYGGE